MSKRTAMMIPPSLEEVELQASKIGLPAIEAQKFFYYYSSNGWKVGRNRMVCFSNAMQHWKLNWMDRQRPQSVNGKKTWAEQELESMSRKLEED